MKDIWRVLRSLPTELELAILRWEMRQHLDTERMDGQVYCLSRLHRSPPLWPCEEFMRADRAVDEVINR